MNGVCNGDSSRDDRKGIDYIAGKAFSNMFFFFFRKQCMKTRTARGQHIQVCSLEMMLLLTPVWVQCVVSVYVRNYKVSFNESRHLLQTWS